MATQNTKTAASPVSKSATHCGLTCATTGGYSVTFHSECEAPIDALTRKADQLDDLLNTLLAENNSESNMTESTFHNLLWLATNLAGEIRLLVEVQ